MARLNLSTIEAGLNTYFVAKSGVNELWDEIASTSDRAIELARQGAPEGIMVLARQQSCGRGRQGRNWVSAQDSGIYVSFVLRPTLDPAVLPLIGFAGGVAAVEAVERVTGVKIGLKWVNDLIYDGKKLGGILAEMPGVQQSSENNDGWILPPAVVLGLGINLSLTDSDVDADLAGKFVSLDHILGMPIDANLLVSELCNALEDQYNHLRHSGHELVLEEWKKHSVTLGKRIKARVGNNELEGVAADLDELGALVLRQDNGEERLLHAGEITIRLENGNYA
jgi:BirA family transcriptional regulator, biotin operon repressor / biotin---[acetyl-CoA-carboxylase] ligase